MLPPSPLTARSGHASAVVGSSFIIWGGNDTKTSTEDDGAALDLETMVWRVLPKAPISSRILNSGVSFNDNFIIIAGQSPEKPPTPYIILFTTPAPFFNLTTSPGFLSRHSSYQKSSHQLMSRSSSICDNKRNFCLGVKKNVVNSRNTNVACFMLT